MTSSPERFVPVELVIPCRDEEESLPGVLARVPWGWSVLVVDNGSTDATAAVARSGGAHVVREGQPGYGAAVHRGLITSTADVVVVLDGDGSIDPAGLVGLVELVVRGEADLVCGARRPVRRAAWAPAARAGNRFLAGILSLVAGLPLTDLAPVRVARREALLGLGVQDRRSGFPVETLLRAGAAGWRIVERPVEYRPRSGGRSKVSGDVRGIAWAVRDLVAVLVVHRKLLTSRPTTSQPATSRPTTSRPATSRLLTEEAPCTPVPSS